MKKTMYLLLAVTVVFASLLLSGCGSKNYDLKNMSKITFSGANGYGSINIEFTGKDLIEQDLNYELNKSNNYKQLNKAMSNLSSSIEYKFTNAENGKLSNADTVKVIAVTDKLVLDTLGISFSNTEFDCLVENLVDCKDLDVFKDIVLEYDGITTNGSATVNTDKCEDLVKENVQFKIENNGNLSNGDKITVIASVSNEDEMIKKGYMVSNKTKSFLVSGLAEYVDSIKQVSVKSINDFICGYVTERMNEGCSILGREDFWKFSSGKGLVSFDNVGADKVKLTPYKLIYAVNSNNNTDNTYTVVYKIEVSGKVKDLS